MEKIIQFFQTQTGKNLLAWALAAFGMAVQGGLVPLDAAVPFLHISVGQLLTYLGLGAAPGIRTALAPAPALVSPRGPTP